jgi:hypothetical protein
MTVTCTKDVGSCPFIAFMVVEKVEHKKKKKKLLLPAAAK